MARQAGGEGDNEDEEDPARRKGQLLIVEASDNSIQTRNYSEVTLEHWFEEAGLNLADFTSAAPPPPVFTPPPKDPNFEGKALGGPENPGGSRRQEAVNSSKREAKPRSLHSEDSIDSNNFRIWAIWIACGVVVIGILGSLV